MKRIALFLLLTFSFLKANSQTNFDPIVPNDLIKAPADCISCGSSIPEYETGIRLGLGFGFVFPVSSKLDITTGLSFQYWKNQIGFHELYSYGYSVPVSNFSDENIILLNLSIGQRFHFVEFESSSFFYSTKLNVQGYLKNYQFYAHRKVALSIEPAVGWKTVVGKRMEYWISAGYDQMITSYDDVPSRKPGSLALNTGFRLILGKGK